MNIGAAFVARINRLLDFDCRDHFPSWRGNPISGHVQTVNPLRNCDGAQPPINIKARALRLHNRNAKAASAYERVHLILGHRP